MAQNFLACDRDQELLLPPSLREWLPDRHLAWFVIDAVAALDLSAFYAAYRDNGQGRAAHDPAMMVTLLLYSYALGERSSRRIERRCVEDVATRVICANQRPDHTTIARFRQRHERPLAELFGEVLALCAEAGLVCVGVIAIDGTKLHANASERATRSYEDIAREILDDAAAVDAEEDERFGDARGDELPSELATGQGRQRWLRDAKRRLDERRAAEAKPIPKSRRDRLKEAKRRLEEEHQVECRANEAYEDYRRNGRMRNGRRLGAHSPPKPFTPPAMPEGKINLTDPDSRNVKTPRGWVQGYNAQAVTTEDQTHLLQSTAAGRTASFYRPTYTPHDPVAAEPGRIALARRHEDIYNAGGTPVDECTRSPVTDQLKESILVMQEEAARQGVTTAVEAGLRDLGVLDALRELEAAGELRIRHLVRVGAGCLEEASRMGLRTGVGSEWVKILGVKLYSDGWLGPRTAALRAPYSDHPEVQYTRDPFPFGILFLDQQRAIRDVARADQLGFNITTHAIGDRGAETVLNAYDAAGVTRRDRWQLEHVQVMGDDLIGRMAGKGVIGSMQLSFATSDQHFAESAVGPTRVRTSYAWKTMLRRGVRLAGGSDFSVEALAPLWGLQRVVTRTEFDGTPPGGWYPQQRLGLATALSLLTSDDAFASFEENRRGRIEQGDYADLTVIRENLFELPEDCIAAATVLMTIANGEIAFEGEQAYPPGHATCPSGAAPAP